MKQIIQLKKSSNLKKLLIAVCLFSEFSVIGQTAKSLQQTDISASVPTSNDLHRAIPIIRFSGLGSISNASEKVEVDPSANLTAQFNFLKRRRGTFFLGYNIGSRIDSLTIDSLKLSSLFFPDKSKNGFTAGLSYDLGRGCNFIKKLLNHTIENVGLVDNNNKKYYYYVFEPYIEYSYLRKNIKEEKITTPRIQTSTWLIGIRF